MRKTETLTFILYGEFPEAGYLMRVVKTQGIQWHKNIVPAIQRLTVVLDGKKRKRIGEMKRNT